MNAAHRFPLRFQPLDEASARTIVRWRYEPPYDLYNVAPDEVEGVVQAMLDPQNAYYCLTDQEQQIVAFCCFGPDAQVPGGDYGACALDIGMGLRPDLTGHGQGLRYVQAALDLARSKFAPAAFRVTVAGFNQRALRVWEKAGFRRVQTFQRRPDGRPFVILTYES
jgi:ribosomal-protein-alanine N-acetyltransferase